LTATVDTHFVRLAKKPEENNLFPSSPKYTIFNNQHSFCVFALLATATGSDARPGGVADLGLVKVCKSMHIRDVVAISGDTNTSVTKLLTFIHTDMIYNVSK
jgi:hypothetical protein